MTGSAASGMPQSITAVPGIRVGHASIPEARTGCTVLLCPDGGAVAGVDVRGAAPATRETDLLRPEMMVQRIHAVLLTGGSAFGLAAADGVMKYLEGEGIGFDAGVGRVPIVPAAALFDLAVGRADIRPTAALAYEACRAASTGPVAEGPVGAGAGATVGKLFGQAGAMRGGVGTAALVLPGEVTVGALVVVNAFGDVRDERTGAIIAGARTPDGTLADTAAALLSLAADLNFAALATATWAANPAGNTTLAVVATDAALTKAEATGLAQWAHDGIARVVSPAHTPLDGDIVFVLSTGPRRGSLLGLGAAAVHLVARAVARAVRLANGL